MAYEQILYETDGDIAVITLNRPDRLNAWTPHMSAEILDALERANTDPSVGAIILTGAGRGFCAGADIKDTFKARLPDQSEKTEQKPSGGLGGMPPGVDWIQALYDSKPLIAAINGPAVGVGTTMVLAFDVLMASEDAQFGMFFVKMGLVPELGSSHFLERRVGFGKANELCLTGRMIDAREALELRLIDRLSKPEDLLEDAKALGREIAKNPAPQLRMIRKMIRDHGPEADITSVQRREGELLDECRASPEHAEAVDAFINKRAPDFSKVAAE